MSDPTRGSPAAAVPLFPLPGLFLFPGTALPLHIFEPRYKQMIEDLLDKSGRFVLGTVVPGHEHELAGAPPVHEIAGLGEIARHERFPDGRFLVFVVGLTRVRISEVGSDHPYRLVDVEPLREPPVAQAEAQRLRRELAAAIKARSPSVPLPPRLPIGQLTDLLLLHLKLDVSSMIDLYSRVDVAERAAGALARHAQMPLQKPDEQAQEPGGAGGAAAPDGPADPDADG